VFLKNKKCWTICYDIFILFETKHLSQIIPKNHLWDEILIRRDFYKESNKFTSFDSTVQVTWSIKMGKIWYRTQCGCKILLVHSARPGFGFCSGRLNPQRRFQRGKAVEIWSKNASLHVSSRGAKHEEWRRRPSTASKKRAAKISLKLHGLPKGSAKILNQRLSSSDEEK